MPIHESSNLLICPQDGNGRVGRLLSSIPLMRCGLPPINIMGNSNLSTTKKEYVDALVRVRFLLLAPKL